MIVIIDDANIYLPFKLVRIFVKKVINIPMFTFSYKNSTISGIRFIFAAMLKESILKLLQDDYVLQGKIATVADREFTTIKRWIDAANKGEKSGLTDAPVVKVISEHFNLTLEQIIA